MASCLNQGSDRWFGPEKGQGFKTSAAHTYQNVPSVPYPRRRRRGGGGGGAAPPPRCMCSGDASV